jgi:hypothetical protein
MVVVLAAGVVGTWGAGNDGFFERGVVWLFLLGVLPFAALVLLRFAPEFVLRFVGFVLRPIPERIAERVLDWLRRFQEGLGALRGGIHLVWIMLYSLAIWLVASTIPMIAGFRALGIDFASLREEIAAAWTTLAAVGIAVAIPSAPGFFGPFQFAASKALQRFGVAPVTAVAFGMVVHAVMWVTITALGLLVLRLRGTSLEDVDQAAGGP